MHENRETSTMPDVKKRQDGARGRNEVVTWWSRALKRMFFLRYSCVEPFLDQPQDASIGHPMLDELHNPLVVHVVEETTNLHPESTSPASARWTQSARPALHVVHVRAETHTKIPKTPPRRSVREEAPLPVGRSCLPRQRCPADVAVRRLLECTLVARVGRGTFRDGCDSGVQ